MEDLTNIWNTDDELNEQQLLNYIKGTLSKEDARAIEEKIAGSSFVSDGVEGLQQFASEKNINAYVQQINANLHQSLSQKQIKKRRGVKNLSWEIIAVIVVIVLCLLGFAIVEMLRR